MRGQAGETGGGSCCGSRPKPMLGPELQLPSASFLPLHPLPLPSQSLGPYLPLPTILFTPSSSHEPSALTSALGSPPPPTASNSSALLILLLILALAPKGSIPAPDWGTEHSPSLACSWKGGARGIGGETAGEGSDRERGGRDHRLQGSRSDLRGKLRGEARPNTEERQVWGGGEHEGEQVARDKLSTPPRNCLSLYCLPPTCPTRPHCLPHCLEPTTAFPDAVVETMNLR